MAAFQVAQACTYRCTWSTECCDPRSLWPAVPQPAATVHLGVPQPWSHRCCIDGGSPSRGHPPHTNEPTLLILITYCQPINIDLVLTQLTISPILANNQRCYWHRATHLPRPTVGHLWVSPAASSTSSSRGATKRWKPGKGNAELKQVRITRVNMFNRLR